MKTISNDIEYYNIVHEILNNDYFKEIDNNEHHGTTRLQHSLRVSYYAYKVSKYLKLNYKETARGGLLHDFYTYNDITANERITNFFKHPSDAVVNADKHFFLTDREKDIIQTHMFPSTVVKVPKYAESWIVSIMDKVIATYELANKYKKSVNVKYSQALIICTLMFSKIF